ncbi:MAG: glycosyltransferase family 4 protein [Dehalococcoidia bacterium]|nr:glycosyltransferase family 4 protein [Dehalococcoidia bacterium]
MVSPYDFAYPGGVTTHISRLADQFTAAGHEVCVFAPCSITPDGQRNYEVVPCGRPVPVPIGGTVARVALSVWKRPRIKALIRDGNYNVVHIHEPFAPVPPALGARTSSALTIGTFHAYRERGHLYRMSKYMLRTSPRRIDGRIAVSNAARHYVSRFFPGDYEIIPNGIDYDRFASPAPAPKGFDDGRINLLFVGRMEQRKGLRYLLSAYADLKWDFPELRLTVVGPGEPDADSQRVMGERNLNDVVFAGRVSDEMLPAYYQSADIFCSPATGSESFGIVLLEAMAAGVSIVASDIAGYRDVIDHGADGLLAQPNDPTALAGALRTLIEDPARRAQMGAAGRLKAHGYRWPEVASRVLDFYQKVASRPELAGIV